MNYKTVDELRNESGYKNLMNRIGLALISFVVLFYATSILGELIIPLFGISENKVALSVITNIYGGTTYMLSFMLPVLFFTRISKNKPYQKINLHIRFTKYTVPMIFAGLAITRTAAYINTLFINMNGADISTPKIKMEVYELILNLIRIALVPAVCEEFLYRGMVLGNILPYGKSTAIIGSALLFGLMHQNPSQLFYTTTAGIVMAFMYIKTGSLWTSMICHFINNGLSAVDDFVYSRVSDSVAGIYDLVVFMVLLLIGIICTFSIINLKKEEQNILADGIYRTNINSGENYSRYPISTKTAITGFFAPANLVFVLICLSIIAFIWITGALL